MRGLVVCTTCRFSAGYKFAPDGRTGGETLLSHLHAEVGRMDRRDITISPQTCLWNCTRPCSVVVRDSERYSYVTGGHEPGVEQAQAIIEWFDLHGATETGEVPFKLWPSRMRGHFIARMPPVTA
jgi:predicted metal-binding protein